MASMDMSKVKGLDRVVAVSALVALIAMFLPWYGYSSGILSVSVSGFSSGYGWIGALLVVAAGVYIVMLRSGAQVPKTSIGPGVLVLGTSLLGTLLIVLRWISLPSGSGGVAGITSYSYGPRVGIILALIAGIIQTVASLRLFKSSGESVPWEKKA